MVTDPRLVIRKLFDSSFVECKVTAANILLEDGVTPAKYEADYRYSEWMLRELMLLNPFLYDLIWVVTMIDDLTPDAGTSGVICYKNLIGLQSVTIDKFNADGSEKVDGIKLAEQAAEEVKRIIRENPYGSLRRIRGRDENVDVVGDLIFGDRFEILYQQYATRY